MKKVWEIKGRVVDANGGMWVKDEVIARIYTTEEEIMAKVEAVKAGVEEKPMWWLYIGENEERRPNVWAEMLEVEGL